MGLSRTALFVRRTVGGLFSVEDTTRGTGARIYVHSGVGTDGGGYGVSPDKPLATLDYAIGLCTANKGDIIFLMPAHAETKAVAGDLALADIAGVNIIGLGRGSLIPTFTLGHADATISVSAPAVRIENVKVISDAADVAVGITAGAAADGLEVVNCWFTDGGLTKELVIGISCAALCDNVLIQNCRFYNTITDETGGCASAIKFVGATTNSRLLGNLAHGHYTVACLDGSTAAAVELLVEGNRLINIDTGAGLAIKIHAGTTGLLINNVAIAAKNNTVPITDVTAMCCAQNWGADVLGAVKAIDTPTTGAAYT